MHWEPKLHLDSVLSSFLNFSETLIPVFLEIADVNDKKVSRNRVFDVIGKDRLSSLYVYFFFNSEEMNFIFLFSIFDPANFDLFWKMEVPYG